MRRFIVFAAVLLAFASRASAHEPLQLSDAALDSVTAGSYASGIGAGFAVGLTSSSAITLLTMLGQAAPTDAFTYGIVTSSAAAPRSTATSASVLLLSLILF